VLLPSKAIEHHAGRSVSASSTRGRFVSNGVLAARRILCGHEAGRGDGGVVGSRAAAPRVPSPSALLAVAVVLFVVVLVLKLTIRAPGFGLPLLFDVPVALVALAYGARGGLIAAAVGMALYAVGDIPAEVHSNVAGYLSRALTFFLLGGLLGLYVDRLRQADRAARRLAAIVEQTDDGVVVCAPDGTITEWNDGAARLFGYGAVEAVGAPLSMLAAPEQGAEQREIVAKVLGGGSLDQYETTRVRKDGTLVEIALTTSAIRSEDGEVVGIGSIVRDITVRKHTERELEEFAYVASHDLQEPLRSIGGFAELLERRYGDQLAGDGNRFVGFIREGVVRMQAMIADLLIYSRAGQARLRSQPVDGNELMRETLSSLDAAMRDTGAVVHVSQLPTVVADRAALAQVLGNLLSNALKFHDGQAPVRVEVSAEPDAERWRFTVADNGLGIAPEDSERVFRMFERLHGEDEYGGTGIGLPICRRIVERHGGRIWCEPRTGGGTAFHFTLPR
jgi:PAS domain S-box-containing protein